MSTICIVCTELLLHNKQVHVKIAQKLQHLNLQCNVTKNNGTKLLHKLCMKISQQKTCVSVELLPLQLCYFKTLIKTEFISVTNPDKQNIYTFVSCVSKNTDIWLVITLTYINRF